MITRRPFRTAGPALLGVLLAVSSWTGPGFAQSDRPASPTVNLAAGGAPDQPAADAATPDWVRDALVIPHPAAAVGGCRAGIYTPAVNGVKPWRQAMVRWLTGRHVMGNTAVLVRQEGADGGAGLWSLVDPHAQYVFEVAVFVPAGGMFGDPQDKDLELQVTVLTAGDEVIAVLPVALPRGEWTGCKLPFSSGRQREVRCIVQSRSPRRLPCFYYADQFRLTRTDQAWWSPQNLFDSGPTAIRLTDERNTLVETLDPDAVGGHNGLYLNTDSFFSQRGIAVGGGQWEQEYNFLSLDDPLAERFLEEGVSRDLDSAPVEKIGLWPGYSMCHNSPAWHAYQQERLSRIAPDVQIISQDNLCSPSFERVGNTRTCFCRGCCDGFRDWLARRWTAEQFRSAEIADAAAFDLAGYVRSREPQIRQGSRAVLADPVLRAFVQFQYASQLDRWRDTAAAVRRAAGHPIALGGNQWGAGGSRPYSVALSQINDVVAVEIGTGPYGAESRVGDVLACKLGLAAGEYRRPVWLYLTSLFHAVEAAHSRTRLSGTQAWSDGGIPTPWATAAGASGWFYDSEARLCRFVQRHRALFARRDRRANVGLVYSLPTHAWRRFPAFRLSSTSYVRWLTAWARILEESHTPYEVNCWWHPLLGDDRASIVRLSRYDVLILPGVDCFSDSHRDAVRAFQARGGRVIQVTCPTACDADAVPRMASDRLAAEGEGLIEVSPSLLAEYTAADADRSSKAADQLQAILRSALGDDTLLETRAPADVWSNLWLDDTRQVLALHLVNGNIDLATDRFRPVKDSRWRLRLPDKLTVTEAVAVSPDVDGPQEPKSIPVEVAGGWATVVVPEIENYVVVAMFAGKALDAAGNLANARRAIRRAGVIRGQADAKSQDKVEHTLHLLRAGQCDAGGAAARELAQTSAAELAQLLPAEPRGRADPEAGKQAVAPR